MSEKTAPNENAGTLRDLVAASGGLTEAAEPRHMKGLTEGRIVHYVIPSGPKAGEHRPAVIVKVWNFFSGYVNLHVLWDGTNDSADGGRPDPWVTSVAYDEAQGPRSWHWIEPA